MYMYNILMHIHVPLHRKNYAENPPWTICKLYLLDYTYKRISKGKVQGRAVSL